MFFSRFEDGSLCPARRAIDGKYHVDGELVIASRESQFTILKLCGPLWEAAKGLRMIVVGPMSRYVSSGCCPEPDHITNRSHPEFYQKMKEDLAACGTVIQDFLFTTGLRNGRLMDPARQLHGLTVAEIWGPDPIHPKKEIYELLADGVIEVERSCGNGKQRTNKSGGGPSSRVLLSHMTPCDNRSVPYHSRGSSARGSGLRGRGGGHTGGDGNRGWKRGGGGSWRIHHCNAGGRRSRWSGPY